jgi:hypothetical protein
MKSRALAVVAVALAALSAGLLDVSAADPVRIAHIWTSYRDTKSFVGLSEHFTDKEATGRALVFRSQPGVRDGFYFTIRLAGTASGNVPDGKIVLHVIAPDAQTPRLFEFPFIAAGKRSVLCEIGLTGSDWPHGKVLPLAWKLEVCDGAGTVLVARESFLWAKPPAEAQKEGS